MTKKLFLDDFRQPKDAVYLVKDNVRIYFEDDWVVVKNYKEFVSWIKRNGVPSFISFDHDLVDEHYNIDFKDWEIYTSEDLRVEETGLDCAKWLAEWCLDTGFDLPDYQVHSANPVGRKIIKEFLDNARKNIF